MLINARAIVLLTLSLLVMSATVTQALAAQLDAVLIPQNDVAFGTFKAIQSISLNYKTGGKLSSMLNGKNERVEIIAGVENPSVNQLMSRLNQVLEESKSTAKFDDLKVTYKARVGGQADGATIEQTLLFDFKLSNFAEGSTTEGAVVDLNWRGLTLNEPIVIKTDDGEYEVNYASGLLAVKAPEVLSILENTDVKSMLYTPAVDYSELQELSLERWHKTFDPLKSLVEAEKFGFKEDIPSKALTVFAKGESSIREGILKDTEIEKDVTVEGEDVKVKMVIAASVATIKISGFGVVKSDQAGEYVMVSEEQPEGESLYGESSFPITVLLVLGGMLGVIAGFVLWRANKKEK